jgi:predicted metal-dependent hydrolase
MTELKQLSIKLPPTTYAALEKESQKREGLMPAPTRTARQLIEERLKQIEERD